jgi:hypothetical protein
LISNNKQQGSLRILGLSQDGAGTDLSENLSVNSLKGDLSNATTFNLPLHPVVIPFIEDFVFTVKRAFGGKNWWEKFARIWNV